MLLVPRQHVVTLPDLPAPLRDPFLAATQRLASAMVTGLGAQGSFVAVNNTVSQSVPHLHCHVVPRTKGDGLRGFFWPRTKYADASERDAWAARVAAAQRSPRWSVQRRTTVTAARQPTDERTGLMGRYDGRVAIVTGAARGIGAGTAKRFAEEGAAVAVLDLDEEQAQASASELGGPAKAVGIGCNVSDGASVEAAVGRVLEELGGLHVLVNNAGITRDNLLFKLSEDDWDSVINVHLKGAFLMSKAAQKTFVAQKYGKILNLSSVSANGNRGQANYSAAKAGVQGFTRTLALELGGFGVNVNAIAPGFIATEMTDDTARRLKLDVEEFRKMNAEANPVKRVGHPEDIAAAAAFLCSDEASYITGQTLYVDGGAKI